MTGLIKICGLSTPDTLESALVAGADMIGLVRVPRSPRHVELDLGRDLARQARGRAAIVLLIVDADEAALEAAVAAIEPDLIQLHGRETPARAAEIRARHGRPVMKALGVATDADLAIVDAYRGNVDRILLDAKPQAGALPGGNGHTFDWGLLAGRAPGGPGRLDPASTMLSGGLTPDNVATAIRVTGLTGIDVSSGVERRPGEKDGDLIRAFVAAARDAFAGGDAMARSAGGRHAVGQDATGTRS